MMKRVLCLMMFVVLATPVFVHAEEGLSDSQFFNSKSFTVRGFIGSKKRMTLKLSAVYRGEPASRPVYMNVRARCSGDKAYRTVDLVSILLEMTPERDREAVLEEYVNKGASRKGLINVCSVEKVNFDEDKVIVSFLKADSSSCDSSVAYEFEFPVDKICK